MNEKITKLTFRGPVHFGNGRLSDSEYACDAATLFSAMFIEALRLGAADDLIEAARCGEFAISDTLPYIGKQLYVPKPMEAPAIPDDTDRNSEDSRARKASKKLKYIPIDSVRKYLDGSFDPVEALEHFNMGSSSLRTKVNLARDNGPDAEPYHVGGFSYAPGNGLYFFHSGSFDISPILEQLAYSGLGGKRTSGYGMFEFKTENAPASPKPRTEGNAFMLLSTAAPLAEELTDELLDGARFRIVRKGGFAQSGNTTGNPRKKRDMWLFPAGSVFRNTFNGSVFDVSDGACGHPVYRYAKAMWMEV